MKISLLSASIIHFDPFPVLVFLVNPSGHFTQHLLDNTTISSLIQNTSPFSHPHFQSIETLQCSEEKALRIFPWVHGCVQYECMNLNELGLRMRRQTE